MMTDGPIAPDTSAVLSALKWLAGQELRRGHRNRDEDMAAAARSIGIDEGRPTDEIAAELRSRALDLLTTLRLSQQDEAILTVLLDRQDIVRDETLEPPWQIRRAQANHRIGTRRRHLIAAFGLHCTSDDFRDRFENPALRVLASYLTGQLHHGTETPRTAGTDAVADGDPRPTDDERTTHALNSLGRQTVIDVLKAMFPPPTTVVFQALTPGMSGSSVFLVYPHLGHSLLPCVVKIGPLAEIEAELRAWETHVKPYVRSKYLPDVRNSVLSKEIGGIAYEASGRTTLNQRLDVLAQEGQLDRVEGFLSSLLGIITDAWNVEKHRTLRNILAEDYPLTDGDLGAFENLCSSLGGRTVLRRSEVAYVRAIWRAEQIPLDPVPWVSRCHGDLYGDNVLVDDDDDLVLIDFTKAGEQHYLRDFVTLEGDLILRLLPRAGKTTATERKVGSRLVELARAATTRAFHELPPTTHEPAETAAAVAALRAIRQHAWRRMENSPGEIVGYKIGLIRRLVRSVARVENGLTDAQRTAGAMLAVALARDVAGLYSISPPRPSRRRSGTRAPAGKAVDPALAAKIAASRSLRAPSVLLVGGVYLDLILEPILTTTLGAEEWSHLDEIELKLGGSCVQVGRTLYERYDIQSKLYSATGGSSDALSVEARRLLSREGWIAELFVREVPGVMTATSAQLRHHPGQFTTMFTHKGALSHLGWHQVWPELLEELGPGVVYIGGYFRTHLHSRLDRYLRLLAQERVVIIDHGHLAPEVESAAAVQMLRQAFARGDVDAYICTTAELSALVHHPRPLVLPPVPDRRPDLISELAAQIALPPVTVVRDAQWPGRGVAYLLLANAPGQAEEVVVGPGGRGRGTGADDDNDFNAGFVARFVAGAPEEDCWEVARNATREGLKAWLGMD